MVKDYSKTKIYCIKVGNGTYYGHTIQPFYKRKSQHKEGFYKYPERKLYKAIREAEIDIDDIELTWIENWSCNSEEEAKARERWWIEREGTLNHNIPTQTYQEYYEKNKDNIADKTKQYRENNKKLIAEKSKQYREKNKEALAEKAKQYQEKNREVIAEKKKQYRVKNKETIAEKKKQYHEKNKEVYNEYQQQYREKNKEVYNEYQQQYREKNKDEINARRRERYALKKQQAQQ